MIPGSEDKTDISDATVHRHPPSLHLAEQSQQLVLALEVVVPQSDFDGIDDRQTLPVGRCLALFFEILLCVCYRRSTRLEQSISLAVK